MPDIRAIAADVKARVSAFDAGQMMGLNPDRQGYCKCPFHAEKTGSLRLYHGTRGWHCFGCGAGGSVIDLVMRYYDLKVWPALIRINNDFGLGLIVTDERPHTRQEEKSAAFRRWLDDENRRCEESRRNAILEGYWAACDLVNLLESIARETRPQGKNEPIQPEFVWALTQLTDAREDAAHLAVYAIGCESG